MTAPPGQVQAASRPASPEQRIQADLTRILFEQAPSGMIISTFNGLLVALVLSRVSNPVFVWTWYACLCVILLARGLLCLDYKRHEASRDARRWALQFTIGAAATGTAWGLSVLLLPGGQLLYLVFLGFVLGGMSAGAIPSLAPAQTAYRLYLVATLLPLAGQLALIGGGVAWTFLTMVILFGVFMTTSAKRYHRTLRHSLELGHANQGLVADLTRERDRIASLFRELEGEVNERRAALEALTRAKEEAESANLAKSQFLANMSHEIRTPMNGILGMIQMLSQSQLSEQQLGYLDLARGSAESLLTIINDILDFSKIEAGKLELEAIPFDARQLAEDLATLFAASAESKQIELTCYIEPRLCCAVVGDPTRLRQVLTNILGNAIKFTTQGEIRLQVTDGGRTGDRQTLEIMVIDTGIGISAEQQRSLFQPFVQADGSTTRKFGGSGLGLTISRNLVELMGGTLGLTSGLGEGSTFHIRLPMQCQAAAEPPPRPQGLRGLQVLAVDAHATSLRILADYLEDLGIRCECTRDSVKVLERLRQAKENDTPFDVAILDMRMPGLDGPTLARLIRADPAISDTKLLLLTPREHKAGQGARRHRSVNRTLAKPVRQAHLLAALSRVALGQAIEQPSTLLQINQDSEVLDASPALIGRILLAEDNPINQKVACGMLRRLGLEVDVAGDGTQALKRLDEAAYDLVLMDVQMPVMDGFAATRALREREARDGRSHQTVVAMTANAMSGDRERCLEAGMDDYIPKPVRLMDLRGTLERWIRPQE